MRIAVAVLLCVSAVATGQPAESSTAPSTQQEGQDGSSSQSLFRSPDDGQFDVSGFLATRQGFLPLAVPITEPAVGYGLAVGLTFFHEPIRVVPGPNGRDRAILPNTSILAGAATENGTWATGAGHLHNFQDGHVRYAGTAGYAAAELDWYGKDDAFDGKALSYSNDAVIVYQQLTADLRDSGIYIGPAYRFIGTDASFDSDGRPTLVTDAELQSQTSGLGGLLGYDTRDHPFSPRRGLKAEASYLQYAEWLGGDFDYGKLRGFMLGYQPFGDDWVLGLRLETTTIGGEVPFYDLAYIAMRGIPFGRYVDNNSALCEAELRWDIVRRWSVMGFGGVGRVADDFGDLLDAESHWSGGMGFRYLVADKFGLRLGLDLAYGDDDATVYVSVGTGWMRP
jgi:hypothetical protein